jgi:hypothetical protein
MNIFNVLLISIIEGVLKFLLMLIYIVFPSPTARKIKFSLFRTMPHGQSVYPDIALHISNYYINSILERMKRELDKYKYKQKHNILFTEVEVWI